MTGWLAVILLTSTKHNELPHTPKIITPAAYEKSFTIDFISHLEQVSDIMSHE
jgi:hypothetical protein